MYYLNFTIHGNPDRGQDEWVEFHSISAGTIQELREKVIKFQGENDIGGGNWGEAVVVQDGVSFGYMSYNLRIWKNPYWGGEGQEEIRV